MPENSRSEQAKRHREHDVVVELLADALIELLVRRECGASERAEHERRR